MPTPRKDETKNEFIKRFMGSEKAKRDYKDTDQRLAVAYSMWEQNNTKKVSESTELILDGTRYLIEEGDEIEVLQTDFVVPEVESVLCTQIGNELYAAYLYASMSAYLDSIGLDGYSHWMAVQSKEELGHAQKIITFLMKSGSNVVMPGIPAVPSSFNDHIDCAKQTLEHEKMVSADWRNITDIVKNTGNTEAMRLCQWFLNEQIEEENNAVKILQRAHMSMNGDILTFDKELGERD